MNATTHPVAPEEIMAVLDGELSADRAQSVSAHIEQCADCGTVVKELRGSGRNLAEWEVGSVPSNIDESLKRFTSNLAGNFRNSNVSVFYRPSLWTWKHWILGLGSATTALLMLLFIATPNLLRSRMAANEAALGVSVDTARTDSTKPMTHTVRKQEVAQPPKALNSFVTLAEPGIAKDSNGLYHGLGDHAPKSFSVDGQPKTDQRTGYKGWLAEEGKSSVGALDANLTEPMIARNVSLSVVVKDFDGGRASLDAILMRRNGYAASLSVTTPLGAARALQASLRIPAPQLAAAVAELKALGRVEAESQNGEEVTQQHADLVARLKNSRETEERLQDVLRTRTGKVKDVLQVEEEIARVRGEIEQMEAEQQALEHRVNFAAIDLNLTEEYKAQLNPPAPSVISQLRNASVDGFRGASESLLGIALFLAEAAPRLVLFAAILFIPARMLWRRYRRAFALGSSLGA